MITPDGSYKPPALDYEVPVTRRLRRQDWRARAFRIALRTLVPLVSSGAAVVMSWFMLYAMTNLQQIDNPFPVIIALLCWVLLINFTITAWVDFIALIRRSGVAKD